MQNEAQVLASEILSLNGESFDPHLIIGKAVLNIIFLLVANRRLFSFTMINNHKIRSSKFIYNDI